MHGLDEASANSFALMGHSLAKQLVLWAAWAWLNSVKRLFLALLFHVKHGRQLLGGSITYTQIKARFRVSNIWRT